MSKGEYIETYTEFLRKFADLEKPLRVVFDCSNGTAGIVLKKLPIKNCRSKIINGRADGNFPAHGPNPLSPGALRQLSRAVKNFEADLGVAFDADGDRAFFIDEKGDEIQSYFLAALFSLFYKPPFVFDIFNFEALKYSGFKKLSGAFPSPVGTYFVRKEMAKHKAALAVEYSGHYYFKKFFNADSGIFTALQAMNAVSRLTYPVSHIRNLLPRKVSVKQLNIAINDGKEILENFKKRYGKKSLRIKRIDGLTFEFQNSWLTARTSNTEPLVRIFRGRLKPKSD